MKLKQNFGKAPTCIRVDNRSELVNAEVKKFAEEEGVTIETMVPYSPSQNGIAERFNRTRLELVRAMLISTDLPSFLWDEAARHATYLQNQAPTHTLNGLTLYEAWTGKKPNVSHLQEFGCDVWVLDETKNKSKLALRSRKMVFVGFENGSKAVRYWNKVTRKIKVLRNVAFNENDEPMNLEVVNVPGISAEGENEEDPASTPAQDTGSKSEPQDMTLTHAKATKIETRNLRLRPKVDYKQLNNPSIRQPPA